MMDCFRVPAVGRTIIETDFRPTRSGYWRQRHVVRRIPYAPVIAAHHAEEAGLKFRAMFPGVEIGTPVRLHHEHRA